MNKDKIINFEGMQFSDSRRARSPRNNRWQVRRQIKSNLGVSRNMRNAFNNLFGLY